MSYHPPLVCESAMPKKAEKPVELKADEKKPSIKSKKEDK